MRFKAGQLFLWFFLVYILYDLRYILQEEFTLSQVIDLGDSHSVALEVTGVLSFFAYTLFAYAILFFTRLKSYLKRIGMFLFLVPTAMFLRFFLQEVIIQTVFGTGNYRDDYGTYNYFLDNLYFALVYVPLGIVFFYVQYSKYKEKQQQDLLLETKKTELAFLRSQVNPHFLFNSLNNIYSLSHLGSKETPRAIEKLSALLRYAIYEKSEFVSVKKEVKYIKDFIELQKMRYDYPLALNIDIDPRLDGQKIPPLILIAFVENAFKHGDLRNPDAPLEITVEKMNEAILFTVKNAVAQQEKDEEGGIGLENTKKRLQLIYGENYDLKIDGKDMVYTVKLKLPIKYD